MTSAKHVRLYVRDSVPAAARVEQQKIVGRLQALEAAGHVDEFDVETWPTRLTTGTPESVPALAAFEEFDDWGRSTGASLTPAFDRHDCHSLYTGLRFTTTVLPVMALAVYEDDALQAVYPHAKRGRPMTVGDGLAILESDDSPRHRDSSSDRRDRRVRM